MGGSTHVCGHTERGFEPVDLLSQLADEALVGVFVDHRVIHNLLCSVGVPAFEEERQQSKWRVNK